MKTACSILTFLWLSSIVTGSESADQESRESLSFQEQLLLSNEKYMGDNILARLRALNDCEVGIHGRAGSPLSEWLSYGEGQEPIMDREIKGLLEFYHRHNGRMDQWIGASQVTSSAAFYEPFKVESEMVKKIKEKEYPDPWRFVAVHVYPHGLLLNTANHPILSEGLGLQEGLWLHADTHVYAFFSFYRKNAQVTEVTASLLDFLKRQTGYHPSSSQWATALTSCRDIQFDRWQRKDYYCYRIVSQPPAFISGSLPELVLHQIYCGDQRIGDGLDRFYQAKCDFFRMLVSEMLACPRHDRLDPYWELYAFSARVFPQISAFRLTGGGDGSWGFIEGYPGDRPARAHFAEDSIVGLAHTLYQQFGPDPSLAEKVFGPLLLLQTRLRPTMETDLKEADVRVGFEGYLDYYQGVLRSSNARERQNVE